MNLNIFLISDKYLSGIKFDYRRKMGLRFVFDLIYILGILKIDNILCNWNMILCGYYMLWYEVI